MTYNIIKKQNNIMSGVAYSPLSNNAPITESFYIAPLLTPCVLYGDGEHVEILYYAVFI